MNTQHYQPPPPREAIAEPGQQWEPGQGDDSLACLRQWICELLIENQKLRMSSAAAASQVQAGF